MSTEKTVGGTKKSAKQAALVALLIPMPWGLPHAGGGILPSGLMVIGALLNLLQGNTRMELAVLALVMWGVPFIVLFIIFELLRKWNERAA